MLTKTQDAPVTTRNNNALQRLLNHDKEPAPEDLMCDPTLASNPHPKPALDHFAASADKLATCSEPPMNMTSGLDGLDRKQMGEERIARISQKRKRISELEDRPEPRRRQKIAATNQHQTQGPNTQEKLATGVQYPDGVVKKTWAYGFPRTGDDIKLEEVIQRENLQLAVLSAFQIDTDVSPHLNYCILAYLRGPDHISCGMS